MTAQKSKSKNSDNLPLKRILLLLDCIDRVMETYPNTYTFNVGRDTLTKMDPILNDYSSLQRACEKITNDTKELITAKVVDSVHFHVEDPREIDRYRNTIQGEVSDQKESVIFLLRTKGNQTIVSIKGRDQNDTCVFNNGAAIAKVLNYLAKMKRYLKTENIASDLEVSKDQVIDSVELIRNRLSKKFGLPRKQMITKDPISDEGYGFLNIERVDQK